jgi:hypothetical protein
MIRARYACAANVVWTVEHRGVRLLNRASGGTQVVPYPQAAVWDLACRNAPHISEKMAHITGLLPAEAERLVAETLEQWVRDGFIVESVG